MAKNIIRAYKEMKVISGTVTDCWVTSVSPVEHLAAGILLIISR